MIAITIVFGVIFLLIGVLLVLEDDVLAFIGAVPLALGLAMLMTAYERLNEKPMPAKPASAKEKFWNKTKSLLQPEKAVK